MSYRSRRPGAAHHDIPTKANRVLNLVLLAMIVIILRIWHLAVIQYDQKLEDSRRPQRKLVIEPATRATIRDRFNLPLAINKIHYQATVLYSQLKDIPSISWDKDADGKKIKRFKRKEYIKQLAQLLADELQLDTERVEDLIHAKASYYAQIPFVIKDELTEKEYYRLRMLQKDWPGIYVRKLPQRYYPRGRAGADVIGYMGSINKQEYEKVLQQIRILEHYIAEKEKGEDLDLPPGIANSSQARKRLKDLEEKAYTIHDYVGKTGIEGFFEEQLRGFYGKKVFYSDSKGNFLRELPGTRAPLSGHRLLLTISAELQEYAEQLLAQNEQIRVVRMTHLGTIKQTIIALKHPWIKGGAIIAMEPQSGEVLALASYPRFDPNDFIASGRPEINKEKRARINRWFENETYIADIWNQMQPLEREYYDAYRKQFSDEQQYLTWSNYLNFVLPVDGALYQAMIQIRTLEQAIKIQQAAESLQALFDPFSFYAIFSVIYSEEGQIPFTITLAPADRRQIEGIMQNNLEKIKEVKKAWAPYFAHLPLHYDKVLLIDLCRLAVAGQRFSPNLIARVGQQSLTSYRDATHHLLVLMSQVKERTKELYHDLDFKQWREKEEKKFLQQKRAEEKASKVYPKPYLDYLDQQEQSFFQPFWEQYQWDFLLTWLVGETDLTVDSLDQAEQLKPYLDFFKRWHQELKGGADQAVSWRPSYLALQQSVRSLPTPLVKEYVQTIRFYQDLNRPLLGQYRGLRQSQGALEKHLASAFYPVYGFGYGRSYAYRQAAIQGSIFKLITAYEALVQRFRQLNRQNVTFNDLNPLIIVDKVYQLNQARYVGYTQDGKPIPQLYKGGRLPCSLAHQNNGEVDLIRALGVSSNPYFSLLAGECLANPEDLTEAAKLFSYGGRTGIDLPGEIAGRIPTDLATNRTGLYAMAIGQHSLVVTPLQTAVMLSTIANGGKVLKPKIVNLMAGRLPSRGEDMITCLPSFRYQDSLNLVGLDFPLFTAISLADQKSLVKRIPTEVKREVFMPSIVRQILLQGLRASIQRTHAESTASLARLYQKYPETVRTFTDLKNQLLGKSSTSESVEHIDLDFKEGTNIYTHVWFGSITFQKDKRGAATFLFKDEFGQPELVVVVYLHFGGYGKEAAPLAAQIVKKWRELKEKYKN